MITTDFFPTDATPSPDMEFTDLISNLSLSYPDDFTDAYYMGWVSWEKLTHAAHVSKCTITGSAGLSFEDITPEQNANIGYIVNYATSIVDTSGGNANKTILPISDHSGYFGVGDKSTTPSVNDNFDFRFINKLSVQDVNPLSESVWVQFVVYPNQNNGNFPYQGEYTVISSVSGLMQFLSGDATITINDSGLVVTLDIADILDNNTWKHNQGGVDYYIAISGVRWFPYNSTNNNNYNRIYPFMYVDTDAGRFYTAFSSYNRQYIQYNPGTAFIASPVAYDVIDGEFYFRGGWSGSITSDEFTAMTNNKGSKIDGNCVFVKAYNQLIVFKILDPVDINNFFTLHMRMISANTDVATDFGEGVYYPHISEQNEYLCEWLHGDFDDISDLLRPWQYGDITDNAYDPEDLPPYEPPYDGERFGGDNITPYDFTNSPINATNNFTTLYALAADTVIDFGQKLWAGLSDPAFWHMVGVEFTNDFSINPADMMKYFLSLRYYPFNLDDYATQTTGIYLGRATTAITPSVGVTLPYLLDRNIIQIDGGSVEVKMDHFNTNDFRVYDPNTQITVYVPYCGSVSLAASEVYGATLYLDYVIDMQTGAIKATISTSDNPNSYNVLATLAGSISADIQITANNNIEFLQRIASVVTGTVTQAGSMAMQGAMSGGEVGAAVGLVAGAATGGVSALAGLPPVTVHKQGTSAGFAGYGGVNRAYITIQTGLYDVPDDFGSVHGWRCNLYTTISNLTGFTVCSEVNVDGLSCTGEEAAEIKRILESGFYA